MKQSEIVGAGLGLFTTKPFKKDQKIANYTGENLSRAAIERRYPRDRRGEYVLCDGNRLNSRCVDGKKTNSSVARFANDARGTNKVLAAWIRHQGNAEHSCWSRDFGELRKGLLEVV